MLTPNELMHAMLMYTLPIVIMGVIRTIVKESELRLMYIIAYLAILAYYGYLSYMIYCQIACEYNFL
jgi:hypothetical protein